MSFLSKKNKYKYRQRRSSPQSSVAKQGELFSRNTIIKTKRQKTGVPGKSDRQLTHSLSQQRRKVVSWFGVTVVVIGVLLFLVFSFTFSVKVGLEESLTQSVDKKHYERALVNFLDQNLSQRFNFLLDNHRLQGYFLENIPEVESALTSVGDEMGQVKFLLKMRQPVASWTISGKQYYVDGQGVVFKNNYHKEPSLKIFDEVGTSFEAGEVVVSQKSLSFIGRTVKKLKLKGLDVVRIILPSGEMKRVDIVLDGVGANIKLSVDRPIGEQVEDLVRSLDYLKGHGLSPEYIDLRLKNRVYYK